MAHNTPNLPKIRIKLTPQTRTAVQGENVGRNSNAVNSGKQANPAEPPKPRELNWEDCKEILSSLMENPETGPFREPVDIDDYPDYYDVISRPVHLNGVQKKLNATLSNASNTGYKQPMDFIADLEQIWKNAKTYNVRSSQIWHSAAGFEEELQKKINRIVLGK